MGNVVCRVCLLTLVALVGCTPTPAPPSAEGRAPASDEGSPKTLIIAQTNAKEGFAPWFISGSSRFFQSEELHTNFLVTTDAQGALTARLAAKLPSLEDGSLTILPDGRMRSVWQIRPNVKWHDGAPFTADDVVFSWQVVTHPEIPVSQSPNLKVIERVEATDPLTVAMTHSTTYYRALELGHRDLYPVPKHLLETAFQGDKDAFTKLPIWSTEYVHTGPFKVARFEPGESIVFERFDDYFLGRPKLSSVVIRIVQDENAILANLLGEFVDFTEQLPIQLAMRLRDEWRQTGAGFVASRQSSWRFISIQFHPEWGGPAELQRDVRTRRGLLFAMDRDSIREVVFPGFPDTGADSFMPKSDPRAPAVGTPFARYPYDPGRALADFAEAGWRRGGDGRIVSAAGQPMQLNIRAGGGNSVELSAIAANWRDLGLDVTEELIPRALARDNEYNARFPSMEMTAQSSGDAIFRRFDSRLQPFAENRYVGSNAGHYVNRAVDRLLDRLYGTVDRREQGTLLRELGEIIAADLPALPVFFGVDALVALKHVRGLESWPGAIGIGTASRDSHLWDRG